MSTYTNAPVSCLKASGSLSAVASRSKSRNRSRSSHRSSRSRPAYVAPVLDPTWQNPYAPSTAEREGHAAAVKSFFFRRERARLVASVVVVVALTASAAVQWFLALVALVVAAASAWLLVSRRKSFEAQVFALAPLLTEGTRAAGTQRDRERLAVIVDRLGASFGVDGVNASIVADESYNAALAPTPSGAALFVTNSLMKDFDLMEVEAVVAHLFARLRTGVAPRLALSAMPSLNDQQRTALAGTGFAFRADEVAAATIRYPLGLARALHRCAEAGPRGLSTSDLFARTRWSWFNPHADRATPDLGDVDDPTLRARALEEW